MLCTQGHKKATQRVSIIYKGTWITCAHCCCSFFCSVVECECSEIKPQFVCVYLFICFVVFFFEERQVSSSPKPKQSTECECEWKSKRRGRATTTTRQKAKNKNKAWHQCHGWQIGRHVQTASPTTTKSATLVITLTAAATTIAYRYDNNNNNSRNNSIVVDHKACKLQVAPQHLKVFWSHHKSSDTGQRRERRA